MLEGSLMAVVSELDAGCLKLLKSLYLTGPTAVFVVLIGAVHNYYLPSSERLPGSLLESVVKKLCHGCCRKCFTDCTLKL